MNRWHKFLESKGNPDLTHDETYYSLRNEYIRVLESENQRILKESERVMDEKIEEDLKDRWGFLLGGTMDVHKDHDKSFRYAKSLGLFTLYGEEAISKLTKENESLKRDIQRYKELLEDNAYLDSLPNPTDSRKEEG